MSKLKVTVRYLDGLVTVYEADRFVTETVQWKLQRQEDSDDDIVLIPMAVVRRIRVERTGASASSAASACVSDVGGTGSFTWTTP